MVNEIYHGFFMAIRQSRSIWALYVELDGEPLYIGTILPLIKSFTICRSLLVLTPALIDDIQRLIEKIDKEGKHVK